jgi:hypothetical protein
MLSTKRTAATLGVLAGLLVAAGPASAQLPPTGRFTVEVGMGMTKGLHTIPNAAAGTQAESISFNLKAAGP